MSEKLKQALDNKDAFKARANALAAAKLKEMGLNAHLEKPDKEVRNAIDTVQTQAGVQALRALTLEVYEPVVREFFNQKGWSEHLVKIFGTGN